MKITEIQETGESDEESKRSSEASSLFDINAKREAYKVKAKKRFKMRPREKDST
jgi:hypothetical protein